MLFFLFLFSNFARMHTSRCLIVCLIALVCSPFIKTTKSLARLHIVSLSVRFEILHPSLRADSIYNDFATRISCFVSFHLNDFVALGAIMRRSNEAINCIKVASHDRELIWNLRSATRLYRFVADRRDYPPPPRFHFPSLVSASLFAGANNHRIRES